MPRKLYIAEVNREINVRIMADVEYESQSYKCGGQAIDLKETM